MTKLLKSTYQSGSEMEAWGNELEANDQEEIIAFYCFGSSEENDEVVNKIKEYKAEKDYILTHNQSSTHGFFKDARYDKYEILNFNLQKDLTKIFNEYIREDEIETIEPLEGEYRI